MLLIPIIVSPQRILTLSIASGCVTPSKSYSLPGGRLRSLGLDSPPAPCRCPANNARHTSSGACHGWGSLLSRCKNCWQHAEGRNGQRRMSRRMSKHCSHDNRTKLLSFNFAGFVISVYMVGTHLNAKSSGKNNLLSHLLSETVRFIPLKDL